MGFDLNRHWVDPSPWAHPTLHGVKELIVQMYNNPVRKQPYPEIVEQSYYYSSNSKSHCSFPLHCSIVCHYNMLYDMVCRVLVLLCLHFSASPGAAYIIICSTD